VPSAGKIMKRVVVCLAPAIAVEGFLGFLNTLNIAATRLPVACEEREVT
jgi:hypothetical protein